MKKGVWTLYCGGDGSGLGGVGKEKLPKGFHWSLGSDSEEAEGCGALVCARGLKEGQKRLFPDLSGYGREEEAISTDLPLSSTRVGCLNSEGRKTVYLGKECEGCEVMEMGCKAWFVFLSSHSSPLSILLILSFLSRGRQADARSSRHSGNSLAYLLLQPCPSCPSQHPPSIGGGAMMDGLLWHFRARSVRARERRVGRRVGENWEEGEEMEDEIDVDGEGKEREEGERIEPKSPKKGYQMKWRELPSAQVRFAFASLFHALRSARRNASKAELTPSSTMRVGRVRSVAHRRTLGMDSFWIEES